MRACIRRRRPAPAQTHGRARPSGVPFGTPGAVRAVAAQGERDVERAADPSSRDLRRATGGTRRCRPRTRRRRAAARRAERCRRDGSSFYGLVFRPKAGASPPERPWALLRPSSPADRGSGRRSGPPATRFHGGFRRAEPMPRRRRALPRARSRSPARTPLDGLRRAV